jgi:hypothetical protein
LKKVYGLVVGRLIALADKYISEKVATIYKADVLGGDRHRKKHLETFEVTQYI